MDGELLRRELDIAENPATIEIIFNSKVDTSIIQAIFQLIKPTLIERGMQNEKTTLVMTRNTDCFLTPQTKDFLQDLYRQGCEVIFT